MRARQYILIFLTGCLLLQGEWLSAQEYLDLWRNSNTDNFYLVQQKFNEYFTGRDSGRGTGYKQFKRWEEFMAPRVYPSGKLINPAKLALDEELRYNGRSSTAQRTASAHGGNWTSLGIKSYTTSTGWTGGMGRVNCITPHPTDPQTLFIGTPVGGIWKTTDGGNTWIPLSDGIPVIGVSGIAINPNNPNNIFILTGDGDGKQSYSIGVLVSTNGGDTWKSTGLQWNEADNVYGYKLLMHPTNRRILFVATNRGIYKTTDGGVSWKLKKPDYFTDMVFKPGDPAVMYSVAVNSYFYASYDSGETWDPWLYNKTPGRTAIGVTPAYPDLIYIVGGSSRISGGTERYNGIFASTDAGQTWTKMSDSPNLLGVNISAPYSTFNQVEYDLAIAVSPVESGEVHVGAINCWRSDDAGQNWTSTSYYLQSQVHKEHYTHPDIHALVFNGTRLYCASDGGVFYSDDNAGSWNDMSKGLEITQFYSIATPHNDMNILYGGSMDNGFNKWTAPGSNMDHQLGGDMMRCVVDYNSPDIVYVLNEEGLFFSKTKDGGATWGRFNKPSPLTGQWVTPLIIHPSDPTKLFIGYNRVVLATENAQGGISFTTRSPDFTVPLSALGMSVANSSYMYAATPTSLQRCTNIAASGPIWTDITGTLPVSSAQITSIQVSPVNANEVWACFSGYASGKKVYFTSDGGTNWTNVSGTLPNVPVNCIEYYNNGQDGIFIGTDIGVFYKDNVTGDWVPFRSGLPNVIIRDLEITWNKIRAATFGRGIWESDLNGTCSVNPSQIVNVSGNQFSVDSAAIAPCTCADNYTLSGDVTGYQLFQSSNTITSTADIMGGVGTEVYYKAANKIILSAGFKVAEESKFLATIDDCNSSGSITRQYKDVYEGVMSGALGIASVADSTPLSISDRLKIYPNPLSRQSTIEFYIPKQTAVTISLWDLSGKMVKILFTSQNQSPGNYQVRLDATGLGSGGYLARLKTQDDEETKKIIIAQ